MLFQFPHRAPDTRSMTMRLLWALSLFSALPAWAATSGEFNVLSFNVAGLPAVFNTNGVSGSKTTNTEFLGSKFAQYGYDVIQVQEVRVPAFLF